MAKEKTYQELKTELDEVLNSLQSNDSDIDKALKLHERGQELVAELENKIAKAENKITKLSKE